MQFSHNMLIAAGIALIAVIFVIVFAKGKSRSPAAQSRPLSRGPASVRFECAGCSQQFTHTKRTIAAWEKGTRRFFCNECHKKWRDSRPPQESQAAIPANRRDHAVQPQAVSLSRNSASAGGFAHPNTRTNNFPSESRTGCLGVAVLIVVLPVIAFVATHA